MRWNDYRRSGNVANRRGEGGRSLGGLGGGAGGGAMAFMLLRMIFSRFGIVGVVVAVGGFFLLNSMGLNLLGGGGGQGVAAGSSGAAVSSRYDEEIGAILATTEDVWTQAFAEAGIGDYPEPSLNLFAGGVSTGGCGFAGSAVGPFYCPGDQDIYIDTSFFEQLERQLGAPGDFARAYVIAHEVGHHIQTVTGISDQIRQQQARASKTEANQYQVRMELMADCFAGVWANRAQGLDGFALEEGDLQEGMRAAQAIGDDTLQRNAGRRVSPDSFTHGTSEQRQRWLSIGYRTGDMQACDTLGARDL